MVLGLNRSLHHFLPNIISMSYVISKVAYTENRLIPRNKLSHMQLSQDSGWKVIADFISVLGKLVNNHTDTSSFKFIVNDDDWRKAGALNHF